MNLPLKWCMTLICTIVYFSTSAQESPWVTSFEEREELNQILKMSNGNYMLSGKTFEIGNKSDLVILVDKDGKEIKRRTICIPCDLGDVIYSKETPNKEVMHIRSSGDIFVSSLDLTDTRFIYNIKGSEFDNVETYQVLENAHFIVIVSYAIKNGVRGLLHTTINTWSEQLISHKFNSSFPDISGSIGIGLFEDVGVVDGYNSYDSETFQNSGHLLRYDIGRELLWSTDLDWGNMLLQHVIVSYDQKIYAVGTIQDENNEDHWQGLVVHYDNDGTFLWEKRFDSPYKNSSGVNPSTTITKIKQFQANKFVLLGNHGRRTSGTNSADAFAITVDKDGEELDKYANSEITVNSEAFDAVIDKNNELIILAKSYGANGIAGSWISIAKSISSAYEPLKASGIEIYPNPATDYLIINDENGNQDLLISIYNVYGALISKQMGIDKIPVDRLESGTYYLTVIKGDEQYMHTFVKQ